MSSPPRVPARLGPRVCAGRGRGCRASVKYLLYFCRMSLNGSFCGGGYRRGGGEGEKNKSCNVVPMQLLTSRVQPGSSPPPIAPLLSCVSIADAACRAWGWTWGLAPAAPPAPGRE